MKIRNLQTPPPSDSARHTATDSDGQTTLASTATSVIQAPTTPGGGSGGPGGSQGPGAPNGTPATQAAILRLTRTKALHTTYAHRAFKLNGTLTDSQGHPIAGATLDVLQTIATQSTPTLLKQITTSTNGSFTATIPPGPSRRIQLAYRAFANEPTYAATASIAETVSAGVTLQVNRRHTDSTGEITFTVTVAGPTPPTGAEVHLLVYYRHEWVPIRTPRTKNHGAVLIPYQFNNSTGRYPFRVAIPAGQANFPYTHAYSNTITITAA